MTSSENEAGRIVDERHRKKADEKVLSRSKGRKCSGMN
jgi:hypothetical protein